MNNAGRTQRAWVVDTELSVDREMIELNTIAPISLTKCVVPHMITRQHGHVVITSSLAAKIGHSYSSYCLCCFVVGSELQHCLVTVAVKYTV